VTTAHVRELKLHPERIEELMRREDPRLIVLDVSPPYVENWEWYRTVFAPHPAVQGRRIVLTTTNRRALQEASDTGDTIELLGKPFDLEQLVAAVRHALR
jgi:DNA-binding response OmpR family regulator